MDTFDEFEELFRLIGLSEGAAKVAATGRYRNEAEARDEYRADEAAELADRLRLEAQGRPSGTAQEIAQITALIPTVIENAIRGVQGLPMKPVPTQVMTAVQPANEAAVGQVRESLRMTEADARAFVARLHAREVRRGGPAHADGFLSSFAEGLRAPMSVSEVAPR